MDLFSIMSHDSTFLSIFEIFKPDRLYYRMMYLKSNQIQSGWIGRESGDIDLEIDIAADGPGIGRVRIRACRCICSMAPDSTSIILEIEIIIKYGDNKLASAIASGSFQDSENCQL